MSDSEENENRRYDKLAEKIAPLAVAITKLQAHAKAVGVFPNDRELLECPNCKLGEDVTVEGLLITDRPDSLGVDTGLRFQPLDDREDWWRCPACGVDVRSEGVVQNQF